MEGIGTIVTGLMPPYKALRLCRCTVCLKKYRVQVSRHRRLRTRKSPCCNARLRPASWFSKQ